MSMPEHPFGLVIRAGLTIALATTSASAQEPSSKPQEPVVYPLQLTKDPAVAAGQAAGVGGSADRAGHRFLVEGITIVQPVAVAVSADDPTKPVEVRLSKYNFEDADRTGTTDSRGVVSFRFRTEGDVRILVRSTAAEAAAYSLMVWAGDEVPADVRPPLVRGTERSPASRWLMPLIAGAVGVVALVGVLVVSRRRRAQKGSTNAQR